LPEIDGSCSIDCRPIEKHKIEMTHFLKDILRQPAELERALAFLGGEGNEKLEEAASIVASARHVFFTGIGSSWHAALSAATILNQTGRPVYLIDAAELLHFAEIPRGAAVVMLSRTGRSIEIVRLLAKAHASGAKVIGITNGSDGALALEADVQLLLRVEFDHGISVNTYSTLALAAGVLAARVANQFGSELPPTLTGAIREAGERIADWRERIENSSWLAPHMPYYFLARGASLGCAFEARLLWEEGVKQSATAIGTGGFRHGPQEIVTPELRFGIWLDARKLRDEDLAVTRDLARMGAHVALIGQQLPAAAAELVFELPAIPADWQFTVDFLPAQLLAERLSRLAGADCDSFRFCSYIVEDEGGLLQATARP
jgi:glucosamine--fructose-6-phosphate aminotransferase (isomerizing)